MRIAAAAVDVALLVVFVVVGRRTHDDAASVAGIAATAWPFLTGAATGWLAARAWRRPFAVVATGVPVWAATVVVGLLLRSATGQGVEATFVVVAGVILAVFLVGWRAVWMLVRRQRGSRASSSSSAS